jgi:hypothetical protein
LRIGLHEGDDLAGQALRRLRHAALQDRELAAASG